MQAEDCIRYLVRSRGLGDVYKRQAQLPRGPRRRAPPEGDDARVRGPLRQLGLEPVQPCLLYTSDAADERSSVDLGGRRILKKKTHDNLGVSELP